MTTWGVDDVGVVSLSLLRMMEGDDDEGPALKGIAGDGGIGIKG